MRGCRTKIIRCGSLSDRIFLIKRKGAVAIDEATAPFRWEDGNGKEKAEGRENGIVGGT